MATNNFKPFATGSGANVLSQADYEALSALSSGFLSGKASSAQINKALRQGTFVSSAVAQFICNTLSSDVIDNGDISSFVAYLVSAIQKQAAEGVSGGLGDDVIGRLVGVKKITSSGMYTKPDSVKYVIVDAVGGGGAGGSPAQNGVGFTSGSGGGNSGCHARVLIDMRGVNTVSCTIGAGGIAVAGSNGGEGGVTSFGTFVSVFGGNGGQLLASSNNLNRIYGMSPLRDIYGSVVSGLLLDFDVGNMGGDAIILSSGARAGFGGKSALGGQTFGPGNDVAGISGSTYGGGGSGVVATNASFGTNLLGGNGAGGVIIIEEYA
ncbi:hypothetical protein M3B44_25840 [Klebsiella quasipneumoniae]|uniref:glycine-rich domain-containing protein n=1 Tax=Klebsiella quasipneumoniae TaxID=1463165 RepID=UPI002ABA09D1|nr:hypothetical protein [Klebsiella quasipneumoniae]MDZ3229947.1 hypothetical protein [Klebsiella quasipneumoniae]MDZ3235275.1 hypothetical protein [Klebsiella quasipneumoniae]HCD5206719.1 hypothetical protein [Klebsiella pneumoniae]